MKFQGEAFTFDDVLLLPGYSEVLPSQVNLETRLTKNISIKMPLISAAMDTVTESKVAITIAQEGGLGVIHKNLTIKDQAFEVEKVKKSEWGMILDPITTHPRATLGEVAGLMRTYKISGVPVTEKDKNGLKLLGILSNRDLRFEEDLNQLVESRMTPMPLVTAPVGTTLDKAMEILRNKRIEKLPVVDSGGYLKGLITIKDIQKRRAYPNASKDKFGRLMAGAAVGVGEEGYARADAVVEAGADVIFIDSAHGHSKGVLDTIKLLSTRFKNKVDVIGGNVATREGAKALIEAGAAAVKVGIGPGSICTTRVISGVGVPQLFAVSEVAEVSRETGIPLIADGGIRFSGDITKVLAAGASVVMIGSLFAGTDESPGEVVLYQGRSYKVYRGMGSLEAMMEARGSRERYFQSDVEELQKLVPEGIEGRVPYRGSLAFNIYQLLGGLRSGMGYCGAKTINELAETARFVKISKNSVAENHPHNIIVSKEAPNYRLSSTSYDK